MKKLLLIILLIVGCEEDAPTSTPNDEEEPCEICAVAWLIEEQQLYFTENYQPSVVIDTIRTYGTNPYVIGDGSFTYEDCVAFYEEIVSYGYTGEPYDCSVVNLSFTEFYVLSYSTYQGDTLQINKITNNPNEFVDGWVSDSVKSISHFVTPNYFEVIKIDNSITTVHYSEGIQYDYNN